MPSDETRRLLRSFGVAVTTLEDAVQNRAPGDEVERAQQQARTLLDELTALIDGLRRQASSSSR
jgi:hypothetical protein